MAIIARERVDRRREEGTAEKPRLVRLFQVGSDDGATVTRQQALNRPEIPRFGDAHPEDPAFRRTLQPKTTQTPDSSNQWEFQFDYELLPNVLPEDDEEKETVGFVEINADVDAVFIDTWREDVPPSNNLLLPDPIERIDNPPRDIDVNGWPIDSLGQPVSRSQSFVRANITSIQQGTPNLARLARFVNTRNEKPFMGAPVGQLLYRGSRPVQRIRSNVWRFIHTFVFDDLYHLRQQVTRGQDGKPLLTKTFGGDGPKVGFPVYWVQPFGRKTDFRNIVRDPFF
jgi:hypothetical protein